MAGKKSLYSVHPGVAMVQKWITTLPEKTGRTLQEWLTLVEQSGPKATKERIEWLKKQHGLGANSAWWIAERLEGKAAEEDSPEGYLPAAERYVERMFAGPKSELRPLYDELLRLGLAAGKDAKACPCQTMVPLYRNHVFAQIKPNADTHRYWLRAGVS